MLVGYSADPAFRRAYEETNWEAQSVPADALIKEHQKKIQLLGALTPRPAPGGFTPDPWHLAQPHANPDAVLWGFCKGCGATEELTTIEVKVFQEAFGIGPPPSLAGLYVHVRRCLFCGDGYAGVALRAIPPRGKDKPDVEEWGYGHSLQYQ